MSDNKFALSALASDDADDDLIFKQEEEIKEEPVKEEPKVEKPVKKVQKEWIPDAELLKDLPEAQVKPVTYSKDEYIEKMDHSLLDVQDEETKKDASKYLDMMQIQERHLQKIKDKMGIEMFKIPDNVLEGQTVRTQLMIAASETTEARAMEALEIQVKNIMAKYPEFIVMKPKDPNFKQPLAPVPDGIVIDQDVSTDLSEPKPVNQEPTENKDKVDIIIDKTGQANISFTKEEKEKLAMTKQIELKIVDAMELKFNSIEDETEETVLEPFLREHRRQINDVTFVLPGSRYRGTIHGLSFTEVLDLSYQRDLTATDTVLKILTTIFDHISNTSIPFQENWTWTDPASKKKVVAYSFAEVPKDIVPTHNTRFTDFLKKTAFVDYQFILWKLLCATASANEIVPLDCGGENCNEQFPWIYHPEELLDQTALNPAILDYMKQVGEASSEEEIQRLFKQSPVNDSNCVELPTSKIKTIFGTVSCYDYLYSVLPEIQAVQEKDDKVTEMDLLMIGCLPVIKAFLVPKDDKGNFIKVTSVSRIREIITSLDAVDIATIQQLIEKIGSAYKFNFAIRGAKCPKCGQVQNLDVGVDALLFFMIQSQRQTQVILKS